MPALPLLAAEQARMRLFVPVVMPLCALPDKVQARKVQLWPPWMPSTAFPLLAQSLTVQLAKAAQTPFPAFPLLMQSFTRHASSVTMPLEEPPCTKQPLTVLPVARSEEHTSE